VENLHKENKGYRVHRTGQGETVWGMEESQHYPTYPGRDNCAHSDAECHIGRAKPLRGWRWSRVEWSKGNSRVIHNSLYPGRRYSQSAVAFQFERQLRSVNIVPFDLRRQNLN
jgi:hypothetical protein